MAADGLEWLGVMRGFVKSTQSCSAESHALIYAIAISAVLISGGGAYVWRQFIRSKPVKS